MVYFGLITRPNSGFQDHGSYPHITETLGLRRGPKLPPKVSKIDFFDKNNYKKENN